MLSWIKKCDYRGSSENTFSYDHVFWLTFWIAYDHIKTKMYTPKVSTIPDFIPHVYVNECNAFGILMINCTGPPTPAAPQEFPLLFPHLFMWTGGCQPPFKPPHTTHPLTPHPLPVPDGESCLHPLRNSQLHLLTPCLVWNTKKDTCYFCIMTLYYGLLLLLLLLLLSPWVWRRVNNVQDRRGDYAERSWKPSRLRPPRAWER